MSNPVELNDFLWLGNMSGTADMGAGRTAEAGKVYPAPDGHRLFYGSYGTDVVFFMVKANAGHEHKYGKFFTQPKKWFGEDIGRHGHYGELRLNATKAVIESFMEYYMGILSVASAPLAVGIAGMNAFVSAGQIKRDWDVYKKAMEVILYNRAFVRDNAPTLYAVVWLEMLIGELENVLKGKAKSALLDAVPGPKVAGKVAGVFIGKLGEENLKHRLGVVNELFKEVLIKVADHSSKNYPEVLSEDQVKLLAEHHVVKILKKGGYVSYIDQPTAEKIVRETSKACLGLKRPLKDLAAALDKI